MRVIVIVFVLVIVGVGRRVSVGRRVLVGQVVIVGVLVGLILTDLVFVEEGEGENAIVGRGVRVACGNGVGQGVRVRVIVGLT